MANIFSKEFTVETVDCKRGLKFTQTWRDNMTSTDGPTVSKLTNEEIKASMLYAVQHVTPAIVRLIISLFPRVCVLLEDFTVVTFKPDLTRFAMQSLTDDNILDVMTMRVYDIAGCNETLEVFFHSRFALVFLLPIMV